MGSVPLRTFNAALAACRDSEDAALVVAALEASGLAKDVVTYTTLLRLFPQDRATLMAEMALHGVAPDRRTRAALRGGERGAVQPFATSRARVDEVRREVQ